MCNPISEPEITRRGLQEININWTNKNYLVGHLELAVSLPAAVVYLDITDCQLPWLSCNEAGSQASPQHHQAGTVYYAPCG